MFAMNLFQLSLAAEREREGEGGRGRSGLMQQQQFGWWTNTVFWG